MAKSVGNIDTQGLTFEKVWAMFQETDRKMQETDRQIKELNKTVGGISNAIGGIIESFVSGGLPSILEKEMGCKIHTISENLRYKDVEIDCLLIGKQSKKPKQDVFICECKNTLDKDDVEYFFRNIHIKIKALQNPTEFNVKPSDNFIYIFGFSKIDKPAKELIEKQRKLNKTILLVKVGGDGSVKLIK